MITVSKKKLQFYCRDSLVRGSCYRWCKITCKYQGTWLYDAHYLLNNAYPPDDDEPVTGNLGDLQQEGLIQIPIAPSISLTTRTVPAVSSFAACLTPAR